MIKIKNKVWQSSERNDYIIHMNLLGCFIFSPFLKFKVLGVLRNEFWVKTRQPKL